MLRRNFLKMTIAGLAFPSTPPCLASSHKEEEIKARLSFWTNDIDYVIATEEVDAVRLVADQYYGQGNWEEFSDGSRNSEDLWGRSRRPWSSPETWHPIYGDEMGIEWWNLDEEQDFTLHDDDGKQITKSVRKWIDEHGYGYFACSEY